MNFALKKGLLKDFQRKFYPHRRCTFWEAIKTIYPQWKEQHTSCSALSGEPLFCRWLKFTGNFLAIFRGWLLLPHPTATSRVHNGPRTFELPIERRRRNHLTTAPHVILKATNLLSLRW